MKRKYLIVATLTPFLVFLDQFTKWLVMKHMHVGQSISVIPGLLSWYYLENPGAAFGLFRNMPESFRGYFFPIISIVAILVVLYYLSQSDDEKIFFPVSLAFVIAGAMGNLTDRIRFDKVVDFVLFEATFMGDGVVDTMNRWFNTHSWPSFNVADTLIVVGIFGMSIDLLFFTPFDEDAEDESETTAEESETEQSDDALDQPDSED